MRNALIQMTFDARYRNYLDLMNLMEEDLIALKTNKNDSLSWKRNFIRAGTELIEGFIDCIKALCKTTLKLSPNDPNLTLTSAELTSLYSNEYMNTKERVKMILEVSYKMFEFKRAPDFSDTGWEKAQKFLRKRDELMHPRNVGSLNMADSDWNELNEGFNWLADCCINFHYLLHGRPTRNT